MTITHLHTVKRENCLYTDLDRPSGLQEVKAPRISRQLAHKGGKVVSHKHRLSLFPREDPLYSFLLEAESTLGS
jgi:hypothetical protein